MAADGWMGATQPCTPAVPPTLPEHHGGLISPLGFCFSPPARISEDVCEGVLLPVLSRAAQRGREQGWSIPPHPPGCVLAPIKEQRPLPRPLPLTCGLLVPKPRLGVEGTDIEWGPMGELMTEKGGPMPLMGELRVLMGEWS